MKRGREKDRRRHLRRLAVVVSLIAAIRGGKVLPGDLVRRCKSCRVWKPLLAFPRLKQGAAQTGATCKECCRPHWNQQAKRRWAENEEYRSKAARRLAENRGRYNEHYKARRRTDPDYAERQRTSSRLSHAKHREARNRKRREAYHSNPEVARESIYAWRKANPGKVKQISQKAARKRGADPMRRLNHRMGSEIGRSLRGAKGRRSWQALVGYNLEALKRHLEGQFKPGMTWANYGQWHIDHIVPLSAFNFSAPEHIDFQRAWSLANLQPLWGDDNMRKHTKLADDFQPSLAL